MNKHSWQLDGRGYIRRKFKCDGKWVSESQHRAVWKEHNGDVPVGYDIHHIDGDKTNNDISNLECISKSDHKRMHFNWKLGSDGWLKPCLTCCSMLPTSEFYVHRFSTGGVPQYQARCKPCHTAHANGLRKKRQGT